MARKEESRIVSIKVLNSEGKEMEIKVKAGYDELIHINPYNNTVNVFKREGYNKYFNEKGSSPHVSRKF
jgi:hypothetical protein